jgi:hypothetical protein
MASAYQGIVELVRKLLQQPKVRDELLRIARDLGKAIAKSGLGPAWQARRQKALAEEVARQTEGGRLSYATVFRDDGSKRTVVWVDGEPLAAFPPYDGDLTAALSRFPRSDLVDPPTRKPKIWESQWWAPPAKYRVWEGEWWLPPDRPKVWQRAWWQKSRGDEDPSAASGESGA